MFALLNLGAAYLNLWAGNYRFFAVSLGAAVLSACLEAWHTDMDSDDA